jgi:hypothetical protein
LRAFPRLFAAKQFRPKQRPSKIKIGFLIKYGQYARDNFTFAPEKGRERLRSGPSFPFFHSFTGIGQH